MFVCKLYTICGSDFPTNLGSGSDLKEQSNYLKYSYLKSFMMVRNMYKSSTATLFREGFSLDLGAYFTSGSRPTL